MPFLTVCPDCYQAQVCVLPESVFPRLKCSRCRIIFDPIGSEDTEVIPELAGATIARRIMKQRAALRERDRDRHQWRTTHKSLAVGNSVSSLRPKLLANDRPQSVDNSPFAQPAAPDMAIRSIDHAIPTTAVPKPQPAPASRPLPAKIAPARRREREVAEESDSAVICGFLGITLAGVALTLSQFPLGWWLGLAAASVGLVLGVSAVRRLLRPMTVTSATANAFMLLLLIVLPSWLGLRASDRIGGTKKEVKVAQVIRLNGQSSPIGEGWVDVSNSFWQYDDVRVTAHVPTVSSARLVGPGGQTKQTGRQYLAVRVHLRNEGVARDFPVPKWDGLSDQAARLTGPNGVEFPPAVFETGWTAAAPKAAFLGPGQAVDLFLYFDPPRESVDFFLLELPGTDFGAPQAIRLKLSRSAKGGRK